VSGDNDTEVISLSSSEGSDRSIGTEIPSIKTEENKKARRANNVCSYCSEVHTKSTNYSVQVYVERQREREFSHIFW
jgi:hypothetical protein